MMQGTNAYAQVPEKYHLLPSCDYGVNILLCNSGGVPIQFHERTYEDQVALKAASEKDRKHDESHECSVCTRRVLFFSLKKDNLFKYCHISGDLQLLFAQFMGLCNTSEFHLVFQEACYVMFILCSAWQKETELSLSFKFKEVVCEGNKITSDHFHGNQQILCVKPQVTEEWREKTCNLSIPPPAQTGLSSLQRAPWGLISSQQAPFVFRHCISFTVGQFVGHF